MCSGRVPSPAAGMTFIGNPRDKSAAPSTLGKRKAEPSTDWGQDIRHSQGTFRQALAEARPYHALTGLLPQFRCPRLLRFPHSSAIGRAAQP